MNPTPNQGYPPKVYPYTSHSQTISTGTTGTSQAKTTISNVQPTHSQVQAYQVGVPTLLGQGQGRTVIPASVHQPHIVIPPSNQPYPVIPIYYQQQARTVIPVANQQACTVIPANQQAHTVIPSPNNPNVGRTSDSNSRPLFEAPY